MNVAKEMEKNLLFAEDLAKYMVNNTLCRGGDYSMDQIIAMTIIAQEHDQADCIIAYLLQWNYEGYYTDDLAGALATSLDDLIPLTVVNVYEVTLGYGGPEEGGWWYDWSHCIRSVEVTPETIEEVYAEFLEEYPANHEYRRANEGRTFEVRKERKVAETESRERPQYE